MSGKTKWIIGGASDCDVVVDRDTVSSHHCQLSWVAPVFILEDLRSTNGTLVNGQRVTTPTPVTRADEVLMGSQIPMPWPDSQVAGIRDTVTIGREPDNDIIFDYEMVSGYHAQLIVEGGRTFLVDVGSTNGTAIGSPDRPVKRAEISTRDTVYLGSFAILAHDLLDKASHRQQKSRRGNQLQDITNKSVSIANAVAPNSSAKWPAQLRDPRVVVATVVTLSMLLAIAFFSRPFTTPITASVSPDDTRPKVVSVPENSNQPVVGNIDPKANETKSDATKSLTQGVSEKSPKELLERNRNALLWVGFRASGKMDTTLFCFASACAVRPKLLVTTAAVVSDLEKASQADGFQVLAYQDGQEIPIEAFRVHPKYDIQNQASPISVEHNIGTLLLKFPAITTCELAAPTAIDSLSLESTLTVLGHSTTLSPTDEYDRLKLKVEETSAKIVGTISDRSGFKPVYKISANLALHGPQRLLDGAPVFDRTGHIVGILSTTHMTKMITASVFAQLLAE